jgi:hypothetical protein
MKKIQEKNKIYNIQGNSTNSPLKPSHMDGKYQSPRPRKSANQEES